MHNIGRIKQELKFNYINIAIIGRMYVFLAWKWIIGAKNG
jgi:hypothetical protein